MTWIDWLAGWPGAVLLRHSGTAWLLVDAVHILGLALLVGSILPLDLRLLGLFPTVPLAPLAAVLVRTAVAGAALAVASGLWLFSMKPAEYLANVAFLCKAGLLVLALANVAFQHANRRFSAAVAGGEVRPTVRFAAFASILLWLSVLLAGRWIGFV